MKHFFLVVASLLMLTPVLFAQDDAKQDQEATKSAEQQDEEKSGAELFQGYQTELSQINRELAQQAREIQSKLADAEGEEAKAAIEEEMDELREQLSVKTKSIFQNILKLAEQADKDADTSLQAVMMVMTRTDDAELQAKAGELLIKHHMENEDLPDSLQGLMRGMPSKTTQGIFEKVIENSKDDRIRGLASLSLIDYLANAKQIGAQVVGNPQIEKAYPELVEFVKSLDDLDEEAVIARYKKIAAEFADVKHEDSTIGKIAERKIKVMEIRANVVVGKVAPEIEGPDIDGTDFKLSDYRGKVVMLDFWGDW